MSTEVLGKLSFLETPDVNGSEVLLNSGGVPAFLADTTANQPLAGAGPVGRVFLDTTVNRFYRDDGVSWIDMTPVLLLDGTANQVNVVDGTNVTPSVVSIASNPIIPGIAAMTLPKGALADRPAGVGGMVRFNTTNTETEQFNGTNWLPFGKVLQVVVGSIPAQSGTTQTPLDPTVPTATEGSQIWTTSFTPLSASSKIVIAFDMTVSHGTAARSMIASLFAGTTNIGSNISTCAVASAGYPSSNKAVYIPGSTAQITFACRVGASGSGTWYINQAGATNTLGGALVTEYTIMELL